MTYFEHRAVYALYPSVVCINEELGIFDNNGNLVDVDMSLVAVKASELEAEQNAIEQTKVDAKENAMNKLRALGLTDVEITALLNGANQGKYV